MAEDGPDLPEVPKAVLLAWGASAATTKGPKPRWTLDQLLDAAVRLGDTHGVDAISMSRLAKTLGSGTMTLYRYVESREDLLILTADRALGASTVPEGQTWQDRLRAWVADLRRTYERHPWLTAIPVGTEPLLPAYLRRLETGLACLEPLGLPGERAITVLTMLWTYTRGDVEQTAQLAAATGNPAKINQRVAARLRAISGDHQVPRVLAVLDRQPAPASDEFEAAIDIIVTGLTRRADPGSVASSSTHQPGGSPMDGYRRSRQELVQIYQDTTTIAVVGASANPEKPGYEIPSYLQSQGYRIIPVNPRGGEVFGEQVFPSLTEIEGPVDVVDVFRPPGEAEAIAEQAVTIGARVLWFQPGTGTEQAARIAADAGLTVVAERCLGATHAQLGLGPGPHR